MTLRLLSLIAAGGLMAGCTAVTVVDTAVGIAATAVETTVDVTTGVASGAVDLVTEDEEE